MATAKKATKSAPKGGQQSPTKGKPAKKTGTAMINWEEQLQKDAAEVAATEQAAGGQFISLKGGRLSYQGNELPGNSVKVIIIDHIHEYLYYGDRYDPDNPSGPLAQAFGRNEDEMRWHENSLDEVEFYGDMIPVKGELCKDSPLLEWGTADTGKGKAAKQMRRLALMMDTALELTAQEEKDGVTLEEKIAEEEVAYLKVPVTSVKGWRGYLHQLESQLKRPPYAVVTEIEVVPDAKSQFRLKFTLDGIIEDPEALMALRARREIVKSEIDFPYAKPDPDAEPAPPRRGGGRGGKGGRVVESAPSRGAAARRAAPAGRAGRGR